MSRLIYEKTARGRYIITDAEELNAAGPEYFRLSNRLDIERLVDLMNQLEIMKGRYFEEVSELDFNDEELREAQ